MRASRKAAWTHTPGLTRRARRAMQDEFSAEERDDDDRPVGFQERDLR
jgi:hypothetical protein